MLLSYYEFCNPAKIVSKQTLHDLCGLPRTLKEAGVPENKPEPIARTAIDDGSLTFNPVEVEYDDALLLLKEAYR